MSYSYQFIIFNHPKNRHCVKCVAEKVNFNKPVNDPFCYATRIFHFFILAIPIMFKERNVRVMVFVVKEACIVIDLQ